MEQRRGYGVPKWASMNADIMGIPKSAGVALATSVSRAVQLAACFAVSFRSEDVKLRLNTVLWKPGILMKDFLDLSLPALANDAVWGIAFSMYLVIMGHLGSDVVAANSIVTVVRSFSTTMLYASGNVGCIILARK